MGCDLGQDRISQEEEGTWELTDELDLHTFRPKDVRELVADYLEEAAQRGFVSVRIIHGKGKGTLRRITHTVLEKNQHVKSFQMGGHGSGQWGATLVQLHVGDNQQEPERRDNSLDSEESEER